MLRLLSLKNTISQLSDQELKSLITRCECAISMQKAKKSTRLIVLAICERAEWHQSASLYAPTSLPSLAYPVRKPMQGYAHRNGL